MIDYTKFENYFDPSWWVYFKEWFKTEDAAKVYSFLKARSKDGCKIFPDHDKTFKAFKLTKKNKIKAVIVGLSPYHTYGKNSHPCADGLAFSNSLVTELSPSLKLFYDAIDECTKQKVYRNQDLSYLAEQGVLLLNYSLTSEFGKASIHADMRVWEGFNEFLYKEVLASSCGIPFLLCGKQAHTIGKKLFPMCHVIKMVEHPAAAARDGRKWNHEASFSWINKIINENNGPFSDIEWDSEVYNSIPW